MSAARSKFEEIGRILREHQRFAVMSHVRPDGDALGSQLALGLSLQQLGKDVRVWNEEGMLEKYSFLPRAEFVTKPPSAPEDFDCAIALDTAIQSRLGTALASVRSAKLWINIDHHPSNPGYGDVVYVDPEAPATAEIISASSKVRTCPSIATSQRIFTLRSPPTLAPFNIQKPARARSRLQRNSFAPVSMLVA